jgi:hypothetical protein
MLDFLMGGFDRVQFAGLALICLNNETKAHAERDLRELISSPKRMWTRNIKIEEPDSNYGNPYRKNSKLWCG